MKNRTKLLTVATTGLMMTGMLGAAMPVFAQAKTVAKHTSVAPLVIHTTMETGKMDGKPGWPKFVPANFHVPAGRLIKLVIKSYDDGNAPIPATYNKVKGTVGGVEYVDGKKVSSVPVADVAHTMTISEGNKTINIPVPVRTAKEKFVTVTAEFEFAKAGNYGWQCYAACGSGSSGWEGAMATNNWMKGTWDVTGPAVAAPYVVNTTMETGKMDGKPGWPKFVPGTFNVPAGKVIKLVVKSYDDGNATIPATYNKVKGTVGGVEYVDGKKVSSIPVADVAHTMTITEGNQTINVPIPVRTAKEKFVTVVAEFEFAKAGNYNWQCYAACGSGSSGWEGAMATNNWMKGVWHVK